MRQLDGCVVIPSVRFETFSLGSSKKKGLPPSISTSSATGRLERIKAHAGRDCAILRYCEFSDVEFVADGREFLGITQSDDRYAVSFKVKIEIRDRHGKVQFPLFHDQPAWTRITYWNLTSKEIFGLKFLRSDKDRLGFISGCQLPDLLMRIAKELLPKQLRLSRTAYERAISLLRQSNRFDEEAMVHFASYIGLLRAARKRSMLLSAIGTYRLYDFTGEAGLDLANVLLTEQNYRELVEAILVEAAARLTQMQPEGFSARFAHILDLAIEEGLQRPNSESLLWQTYQISSKERTGWVLQSLYDCGRVMGASRPSLRNILRTLRSLKQSPRRLRILVNP